MKTEPAWLVATGMQAVPQQAGTYREGNYHDLVDKPFFVGRMDYDSTQVDGTLDPARHLSRRRARRAGPRARLWDEIGKMIPAEAAVFQETPWPHYTVMMIFDSAYGGGSALEHTNSHVGIYSPGFIGNPILASHHRARDLPRLEREAAPPGRHGAVPLRPQPSPPSGSG